MAAPPPSPSPSPHRFEEWERSIASRKEKGKVSVEERRLDDAEVRMLVEGDTEEFLRSVQGRSGFAPESLRKSIDEETKRQLGGIIKWESEEEDKGNQDIVDKIPLK